MQFPTRAYALAFLRLPPRTLVPTSSPPSPPAPTGPRPHLHLIPRILSPAPAPSLNSLHRPLHLYAPQVGLAEGGTLERWVEVLKRLTLIDTTALLAVLERVAGSRGEAMLGSLPELLDSMAQLAIAEGAGGEPHLAGELVALIRDMVPGAAARPVREVRRLLRVANEPAPALSVDDLGQVRALLCGPPAVTPAQLRLLVRLCPTPDHAQALQSDLAEARRCADEAENAAADLRVQVGLPVATRTDRNKKEHK